MPWKKSSSTHPVPLVVTTDPLSSEGPHTSQTLDSNESFNSSIQDGVEVRHRRGPSVFRGLFQRMRIATHMSRARRAENVTSVDANAVLGDLPLDDVTRFNRQESTAGAGDKVAHDRQLSAKSHIPLKVSPSHQNLVPTESLSTTRNYTLSKGSIHFWRNYAFEAEGRPFLKVNHDVHIEDVATIMHRMWLMEPPRIVALVISNVASLREWTNTRQRINFQKGLMKAANTTNMWIFTNGTNIGASKVIGDAVYQENKERQCYHCHTSHSSQGNFLPAPGSSSSAPHLNILGVVREDLLKSADSLVDGKVLLENQGNSPEEQKFDLNPDHSHYLVVRDNTINKTGINLFMLRVMSYLSTAGGIDFSKDETNFNRMRDVPDLCTLTNMEIPVVSIVIQGGYDCARIVVDCLKRQFPVVVLRGSGGLADLIAYVYMELKQRCRDAGPWGTWDPEYVESFLKPELSNKISHHFPKLSENALARNMFRDRILECVRLAKQNNLSFLTVLNMHNYSECNLENLSVYLLRALFKSKPRSGSYTFDYSRTGGATFEGGAVSDDRLLKELYLTLDWNCPDVARDEVLIRDPAYVVRLQKDLFQTALLRHNREDFVDLFLTHGFRLHKFITPTRLRRLFKHIYNEEFFRTVCWEGVLGHSLLSKPSKYFIDTDLNWLIETCTGLDNFVNSDHLYYNVMSMYIYDANSAERKALSILTLWAVFGNRQKLAKTLWKHSDQPIHLALIVSMTYDRMSWYVGETSLKTDLKEQSKLFADMATGVLDACYKEATCRAFDVLSEESPDWNYKTAVDIAANARTRSFLAHPCCQKWLTNTFLGEIRIRELSWGFLTIPAWIKILLSAFLIFPMYIWVRFKPRIATKSDSDKGGNDPDQDEDEKDGMGGGDTGADDAGLLSSNQVEAIVGSDQTGMGGRKGPSTPSHSKANANLYATMLRDREVFIRSQPPLWRMVILMWSSPITKFWTFHIFYIFYLILFSIAVLWPSCGNKWLDAAVCSWTALIVVEYIRRTWILYRKYTSVPLVFKCIEILLIVGFVVVYASSSIWNLQLYKPYTRKVILCIALLYFYYRLIAIYLPISPTLGPMLYRLKLMILVDFANFMRMALVLIVSGGIVMQSITYPDAEISVEVFRQGFHRAWFALFLTPTEDLKADDRCKLYGIDAPDTSDSCFAGLYNSTGTLSCPTTGFWPYVFTIQYLVLLKLIMITLLYALFASTASKLQTETDAIWKYQRYILVVDFSNRLPLPAPLSIVCYVYFILRWLFRMITCYYAVKWCKSIMKSPKDKVDGITFDDSAESKYNIKLSEEDYNFWRHLAREFSRKQEKIAEEADINKKQWESIQSISEEIEYEKKVLRQLKGRVAEVERMMTLSHVYLENIKLLASIKFGGSEGETTIIGLSAKTSHHILSRQSPYPGTRVQRMPVPDKFVPWEVMWIDYDPVAYTKQKYDFPNKLQQFVDEDILLLQELNMESVRSKLPVYRWNCASTSPAGITIDRTSWVLTEDGTAVVYKLDNAIPRNPFGRTGMRGKGSLPRWGPNHYVLFIITRWQSKTSFAGGRVLEFVVEKNFPRWDQYTIPGRFIPGENLYLDLQTLFKVPPEQPQWTTSKEMTDFFKDCATPVDAVASEGTVADPGVKCEKLLRGYMDDPFNSDHSWKEVELWHIHYTTPDTLGERMQQMQVGWRIITEDVFIRLPSGQSALLHEITNKLQPIII